MIKNISFIPVEHSSWRKIALGSWNAGGDPSVYGKMDVHADLLLNHFKKIAASGKKPPTITLTVAKAVALTMHQYPLLNGLIRFGKIYRRPNVQLFLQTTVDTDGKELSGVVIEKAETKTIYEMEAELRNKASAIREDRDPQFKKVKSQFKLLPSWVLSVVLKLTSFLIYTLNLNVSFLGLPRDPFGSVMITSIGSLGLDEAYAPLVPYSKVPVLIAVGALQQKPIVNQHSQIVAAHLFSLCVTLDHRFIDGLYASKMSKKIRHLFETEEGLAELFKEV